MAIDIPVVSIVLGLLFLIFIYVEIRVKTKGIFAGLGIVVNIVSVVLLFSLGTELESVLLYLLCEVAIVFALIYTHKENTDVI